MDLYISYTKQDGRIRYHIGYSPPAKGTQILHLETDKEHEELVFDVLARHIGKNQREVANMNGELTDKLVKGGLKRYQFRIEQEY